jgi:putative membrane protein (TIGR04086 family)
MKKHKRKELGLTALLVIGAAASIGTVFVMAFILAFISSLTKDPTSLTGAFSLLALILAGAVSGFVISRANGDGGTLVGILSSVIATGIMIIVGLVWKCGFLPLGALLNLLAFLAVAILSSIIGKKRARKRRRY